MRVSRHVVADPASQMVTEMLEEQGVEAEEPAHGQSAPGLEGSLVDRMPPLLRHSLCALGDLAAGPVGGGQHDP